MATVSKKRLREVAEEEVVEVTTEEAKVEVEETDIKEETVEALINDEDVTSDDEVVTFSKEEQKQYTIPMKKSFLQKKKFLKRKVKRQLFRKLKLCLWILMALYQPQKMKRNEFTMQMKLYRSGIH